MSKTRRTALVTGAGQNIGRAVAVGLAADGFDVIINGRKNRSICDETAEMCIAAGARAEIAMGDVGTRDGAVAVADAAISTFGQVDVLVHNAAIRPETPFLDMDDAEWDEVLGVNFLASYWLTRRCLPGMVAAGWGRLINFAGMNAINGYNGRAHVSASKHAAWGLTKALAKEFGPKGITANIISPGPTRSEHEDPAMTAHVKSQVSRIPMGRLGEPDEIAALVSLLSSDRGGFINGQLLQVNGGTQT
ncbi:MAG: SDR family oxidoreductase [Pseudomonadota bacterium]